ncbi:FecR domain-containing protein [Marinobacterium sp. AK62]|uniref:FecR domain-containing protein n=1 Tax=Marinobacterium alkalitolerans TaxID=1542925 RepID=A0ABS3ZEK7_9GAMM|nr:FecR family protein [Marinobacterium alkalitolerans]MBP0049723.1 FecR domain-containing protein [Marinobacterium alkalitolerans]
MPTPYLPLNISMYISAFSYSSRYLCWLGATLLLLCLATSLQASVGHVQFVSGTVLIDGQQAHAKMPLKAGSQVETGTNGMAHLRFVDNAFISLRPNSRLTIDDYHYNPEDPVGSRVKLQLQHGTVRSITGQAGEANRSGFIMNTPVAAIGIRGTDFIALTDQQVTQARVVSGAIAIREGSCSESTDCWNTPLTALDATSGQFIEVRQGQPALLKDLLLLPPGSPLLQAGTAATTDASAPETTEPERVALDNMILNVIKPTPPPPVYSGPAQVVWGRWHGSHVKDGPQTPSLSAAFEQHHEIIGRNNTFGLLRTRSEHPLAHWPTRGNVNFSLTAAETYIRRGTQLFSAPITRSNLNINFNTSSFQTSLSGTESLFNSTWKLQAQGSVNSNGFLINSPGSTSGRVVGTLSTEGDQAGYLFTLPIDGYHLIEGATLWTRQPGQ